MPPQAITLSANLALRGANPLLWPLESALQAVAQLIVAGLNDVALVWCLAPVVRDPADEEAEAAGERLPAHVFESGDYTLGQRGQAFAAKAQLYAVIGAFTGLLSTVLTAVLSREASLFGAAVWARATLVGALHLGISANVRYQLVNGVEVVLYSRLPTAAARSASVALRFANNVSGTFLWIALSAAVRAVWVI